MAGGSIGLYDTKPDFGPGLGWGGKGDELKTLLHSLLKHFGSSRNTHGWMAAPYLARIVPNAV